MCYWECQHLEVAEKKMGRMSRIYEEEVGRIVSLIFIYLFWLRHVLVAACRIFIVACLVVACGLLVAACMWDLVPRTGIKPGPPALGAQRLTHWTTRDVPNSLPKRCLSLQPSLECYLVTFCATFLTYALSF